MMWTYGQWGGFPWMWIFPLVFFVAILVFIFRGIGLPMCGRHHVHAQREDSAREILDQRYARGEINQEEYYRIKKDILL